MNARKTPEQAMCICWNRKQAKTDALPPESVTLHAIIRPPRAFLKKARP
ncbi:hypothetical protein CM49_01855 [Paenibacillus sp. P1XP2]|nr:hypothetical protein CM49_01855 [Paenibacillus sp. P1XP2]